MPFSAVAPVFRLWRLYGDPEYFDQFPEHVVANLKEMESKELRKLELKAATGS